VAQKPVQFCDIVGTLRVVTSYSLIEQAGVATAPVEAARTQIEFDGDCTAVVPVQQDEDGRLVV
jgi:hypothetical protein